MTDKVLTMVFSTCLICCSSEGSISKSDELETAFVGYDINGTKASCKGPKKDIFCTMDFTEEDQFSADCKNRGFKSFQCACHKFLCSQKLDR